MSRRHSRITHPTAKPGYSEDRQRAGILHFYTRGTSNQHQQSQHRPMTKAVLTFPAVFRKALWSIPIQMNVYLIYITLFHMHLSTLRCRRPDAWHEEYAEYTNGPRTDIRNICTDSLMMLTAITESRGVRGLRLGLRLYRSHSHTFSAMWKLAAVAGSNN